MIVITGAAGFIASNLARLLNSRNFVDLVLVDDFSKVEKKSNFESIQYTEKIDRDNFFQWLNENHRFVQFIFHLGARTDTTEFNKEIFDRLNLNYSKKVWNACVEFGLPLVYASSAATYGDGTLGYSDNHLLIDKLKPLNPYGDSKNDFDKWVLNQEKSPFFWAGLKFFNVYGPGENHKGRMASVVFHAYHQILKTGKMNLFRSHHPDYKDGGQLRDFIYVKDVCSVMFYLMQHRQHSGIYNLGTGKARTFIDLVRAVFTSMNITENISFVDTPADIRDKYQYYTQADMSKLKSIGYSAPFASLEEGIADYISQIKS